MKPKQQINKYHALLEEQLKNCGVDLKTSPPEVIEFVEKVNVVYQGFEQERGQLQGNLEKKNLLYNEAQSELDVVFSTFPDMFFRLDEQNRLLNFKTGVWHQKYLPIEKMLNHSIDSMPLKEVREPLQKAITRLKQTGEVVSTQFKAEWNSQVNYFEARFFPTLNSQIICVVRNITTAKSDELALIKSEHQYRTVLESSPDPIIVYDMKGHAEYVNPAFTRVFGWSLEELKNDPIDFVPSSALAKTNEKIRQLIAGVDIQGFETQRFNRGGEILDVIINASLRMGSNSRAIGSVVTIVDITPLKKLEAELRYTRDQAESANQAKSEFLANMSHELRTPMHAILGFAKIIIEKIDSLQKPRLLEYVEEVYSAGQRLMLLLNDLLDLSKLEVGRVDYDMQLQSLAEIITLVIHEFSSVSAEKEIEIEFEKPDLDDQAWLDQNKMIQVARNLLSNAIKFSPPQSKVIIKISKQSGILMLSIKDFGIGIPPNELESVFDKFVQSSKSKSEAGGTGLGLAICLEIIEAHEGRIWAKNNPEGGTTFFVTLSSA